MFNCFLMRSLNSNVSTREIMFRSKHSKSQAFRGFGIWLLRSTPGGVEKGDCRMNLLVMSCGGMVMVRFEGKSCFISFGCVARDLEIRIL